MTAVHSMLLLMFVYLAFPPAGLAQVQITSPASGTTVIPGISVMINVQAPPAASAVVIGSSLFQYILSDVSFVKDKPPYTFTVPISPETPPGEYAINAYVAYTGQVPRKMIPSATVRIVVVPSATPLKIKAEPSSVLLLFKGREDEIAIYGEMSDGTVMSYNGQPGMYCQSADLSIARIIEPCTVVAVNPGSTNILVRVGPLSTSVPVSTRTLSMRGDFDGDQDVDADDINRLTSWRNRPASATGDDRDLNGDGKIDALDVRVLTTMCTRPRCAIQ